MQCSLVHNISTSIHIISKDQHIMNLTALALCMMASATSAFSVIKAGQKVPDITFNTRVRIESDEENPFDWLARPTSDYFADKRVVLFSLPGAFTPTCSSTHLPGYENNYEKIKALGVDEVYCLNVNDEFAMRQWGLTQGLTEDKTTGSLGFI